MYSLNRAMILGNVTRDLEVRQTASGQSVCSFSVATNRRWKDTSGALQEKTDFHDVVAWGKLAEICGQYLARGRRVYVEGRLQTREWEGKDGQRRFRTEIIAENLIMLDRAGGAPSSAPAGAPFAAAAGRSVPSTAPTAAPAAPKDDPSASPDDEIRMEDIPF